MKIIISPAKKMTEESDWMEAVSEPVFAEDAKKIAKLLSGYSREDLKTLFGANDQIVELNYKRYQEMGNERATTPALLSYVGLQYQSMAPGVFSRKQWDYVLANLRILSGFYGLLRPSDRVMPYRLEMQAKLKIEGKRNLYDYWGSKIFQELTVDDNLILNLASKEYSKVIEPFLDDSISMITCVFGESIHGNVKVKATAAKAARGDMVCWLAKHNILKPEDIKNYRRLGYEFSGEHSDSYNYVFLSNISYPPGTP